MVIAWKQQKLTPGCQRRDRLQYSLAFGNEERLQASLGLPLLGEPVMFEEPKWPHLMIPRFFPDTIHSR